GPRQRRASAGGWAGVAFSYGAAKRERPGAQRVPGRSGPATARGRRGRSVDVEEAPQLLRAARMAQLAQRLGLDLADALAGDVKLLAHLFQGVVGVHVDAEARSEEHTSELQSRENLVC